MTSDRPSVCAGPSRKRADVGAVEIILRVTLKILLSSMYLPYYMYVLFMYRFPTAPVLVLSCSSCLICTSLFRLQLPAHFTPISIQNPPHLLGCLPGTIPLIFLSLPRYSWNSKGTSVVATITLSSVLGPFDAMG